MKISSMDRRLARRLRFKTPLRVRIWKSADPEQSAPLQRAANEAAGLAWFTPFPLLFFPALLEEKIYAAQRQEARQQQIRQRGRRPVANRNATKGIGGFRLFPPARLAFGRRPLAVP